jgi:hypothetical protein
MKRVTQVRRTRCLRGLRGPPTTARPVPRLLAWRPEQVVAVPQRLGRLVGSRGEVGSWWSSLLGPTRTGAGKAILGGTDLKLVGVVVDDYPAERFSPPLPERARVACIDDRLLPDQGHNLIVEAERPRRPLPPGRWDETHTDCPLRAPPACLDGEHRTSRHEIGSSGRCQRP